MALTPKREAFVQWLIKGKSQREAYRLSYNCEKMSDRAVDVEASRLFKRPDVTLRFEELRGKIVKAAEDECIVTVADVLREYKRLGFFDPRKLFDEDGKPIPINQLDDDTAAAIAGLDVLEEYEGSGEDRQFVGYTKKYKVADKKGALDSIAKHLGMFVERIDHSGSVTHEVRHDLRKLSPEELLQLEQIIAKTADPG